MAKRINSKRKGKKGELEVSHIFKNRGYDARRGQQFSGGDESPDVIVENFDWHLEVKFTETFNLYKAMAQAERDCKDSGKKPLVIHRKNKQKWVAVLDLEHFLDLVCPSVDEAELKGCVTTIGPELVEKFAKDLKEYANKNKPRFQTKPWDDRNPAPSNDEDIL